MKLKSCRTHLEMPGPFIFTAEKIRGTVALWTSSRGWEELLFLSHTLLNGRNLVMGLPMGDEHLVNCPFSVFACLFLLYVLEECHSSSVSKPEEWNVSFLCSRTVNDQKRKLNKDNGENELKPRPAGCHRGGWLSTKTSCSLPHGDV